jgi:hypothetical protein
MTRGRDNGWRQTGTTESDLKIPAGCSGLANKRLLRWQQGKRPRCRLGGLSPGRRARTAPRVHRRRRAATMRKRPRPGGARHEPRPEPQEPRPRLPARGAGAVRPPPRRPLSMRPRASSRCARSSCRPAWASAFASWTSRCWWIGRTVGARRCCGFHRHLCRPQCRGTPTIQLRLSRRGRDHEPICRTLP